MDIPLQVLPIPIGTDLLTSNRFPIDNQFNKYVSGSSDPAAFDVPIRLFIEPTSLDLFALRALLLGSMCQ